MILHQKYYPWRNKKKIVITSYFSAYEFWEVKEIVQYG